MRQELINQTQEMAATATAALETILALRLQLLADITIAKQDPAKADHLAELEKKLQDIHIAIIQVRMYLLGFHRTLTSAQALAEGNIEIPRQIANKEKPRLIVVTKL